MSARPVAARRLRLGMITPSSNTVLEPVTAKLLGERDDVSVHYARIRVTEISLAAAARAQFDPEPMLQAAELLADARCDAICWNGTSAGWLGIDRDRRLCAAISERTGIPATTAVLAILEAFRLSAVKRFGLVSPYTGDVQQAIVATLRAEGFECVGERHADVKVNFDFSRIGPEAIESMIREVAAAGPDAIVVFCTNMDGATLAEPLGRELCIPIFDSIAAALWGALRAADPERAAVVHAHAMLREIGAR